MTLATVSARIVAPIPFVALDGKADLIPAGPCLLEQLDERRVDVVWGQAGEDSAVLQLAEVETAERAGKLVVLD
ncbi:MAG TPA: hypothetical protein VFG60_06740 [Burkholderiaceae bacterium]|nr:hypothetical protein [Burkholderiaceae bacterium]